jgi:cellulose synthase/poly-beta-1,6-N-acetylglucosamine synthase-like glycosyltransferase
MDIALQLAGLLLLVPAGAVIVPACVLLVQVIAAMLPGAARGVEARDDVRPTVAVLMPAHDEAAGIAASIATVVGQLRPGDRLLVVADNCTDDTAAIARAAGAEVIERQDPVRRGKGYALDFGVRRLAQDPPAIVVIVDADCALAPQALGRIAARCARTARPVQALYLMRSPPGAGLRLRIAEFAWVVKNEVRPLGFLRLGLPCQLMGTGMAFPWPAIQAAPLASGHLVEDMQLGLDLAMAGAPALFCPQASVTSVFPSQAVGAVAQRTRWEHGHLSVIVAAGPKLFWQAFRRRDRNLAALALDLCVPPLASLVLIASAVVVCGAALAWAGGSRWPLLLAAGALVATALAVLMARHRFGRHIVTLAELLTAPAYVLNKVPMYARLLGKRQSEWVRTRRGDGPG